MKTTLRFSILLVFTAAVHVMGAFESVKLSRDNAMPEFPGRLVRDGVTDGHVIFAVSVTADGKLKDALPLAYTHETFVQACESVMREWAFVPARLDGENVPVQMELRFDFRRDGVVETDTVNISNHFLYDHFAGFNERLAYRLPRRDELDRSPSPVSRVEPQYAIEAKRQGVSGKVRVYFYIDEKGEVRLPSVSADAHPYLSDLAVTALKGWRFEPATSHGQPVMVAATQEFDFGGVK